MKYKRTGDYNTGFSYVYVKTGSEIADQDVLEWIKSLKIPPAYTRVHIEANKNAKILAYGYDSKNRKQYIYNPVFIAKRSMKKYNKIISLNEVFNKIIQQIQIDMRSRDLKLKEIAMIIHLIIYCGFRIGNKSYEKANSSYGISTIKFKHIDFKKGVLMFDFIGKKGVRNMGQCEDKYIFKYLRDKKKSGILTDNVFDGVTSGDVNEYLRQFHSDITSKDLRTWNANTLFIKYAMEAAAGGAKNPVKRAIENVSLQLHNTVSVCKKNYIDPKVIEAIDIKIKNDNI